MSNVDVKRGGGLICRVICSLYIRGACLLSLNGEDRRVSYGISWQKFSFSFEFEFGSDGVGKGCFTFIGVLRWECLCVWTDSHSPTRLKLSQSSQTPTSLNGVGIPETGS